MPLRPQRALVCIRRIGGTYFQFVALPVDLRLLRHALSHAVHRLVTPCESAVMRSVISEAGARRTSL
jgi:hypothetical protein